MIRLMKRISEKRNEDDTIFIVSGLPRTGTSMMMRILEAGGLGVVTDNERKPDKDNPRGYYEFERVKKIAKDFSWLRDCRGKAFKMVSALLPHLPRDRKYKIIFMKRNLDEVLSSQSAMLKRLGREGGNLSDEEMSKRFKNHLQEMEKWIERQPHLEVLYADYNKIMMNPLQSLGAVCRFIDRDLDAGKMASVVENGLYRQRCQGKIFLKNA
ncbi:MAG: sulfotransferase family protein [Desulfobacteraceae bacterium]|nr:MAG: sulfotransferase family protein [Desulfobacteraceae bacterium]